jgi:hypothetical protein
MIESKRLEQLRASMIEHLEAALACADETQDGKAGYFIERALDEIRAVQWPSLDPNLEQFRKGQPPRSRA